MAQRVTSIDSKGTRVTTGNIVTTATTAPTDPLDGDIWFDNSAANTITKVFDGTVWKPIEVDGGATTSDVTALGVDYGDCFTSADNQTDFTSVTQNCIIVNGSGFGSLQLDLPDPAAHTNRIISITANGKVYSVNNGDPTNVPNSRTFLWVSNGTQWIGLGSDQ